MASIDDIQDKSLKDEILNRLAKARINICELTKRELHSLEQEVKAGIIPGVNALDGVLHWAGRRIDRKKRRNEIDEMIRAAKAAKTILLLIIATLFIGCGNRETKIENCAVVSISPLKPLVQEILGNDFEVIVLVPQGASPETFEPTPKQLQKVESARFVFGTGLLAFEQELLNRVARKEQIINLSQGIETISGCCSHSHHHGHAHGVDPHIWCSPKSLIKMAENMQNAIALEMPDSTKYIERYNTLNTKLLELDEEVADKCNKSLHKSFLIYHPALTYLARDYGLTQIAIENEGKEPSSKRLNHIIKHAREDGVKHVFYQSEFPASSVEVVCNDIGATAVEINPLDENIIDNIRHITTLITE